ncbi:hypothetical protein K432DRAFT_163731 [Lepidopterella palustris CBS 459.81]|uniref:Uncharacterized protein n=1 Tax=Lepidopterella palustris CBS 459.81 TaxID=1314670 RepID=A0A8E2JID7_9PEZI|nr:hypothetical protein K432DRAFT_163731 [Lepidopterella palustris CBS 459.81]
MSNILNEQRWGSKVSSERTDYLELELADGIHHGLFPFCFTSTVRNARQQYSRVIRTFLSKTIVKELLQLELGNGVIGCPTDGHVELVRRILMEASWNTCLSPDCPPCRGVSALNPDRFEHRRSIANIKYSVSIRSIIFTHEQVDQTPSTI